MAKRYHQDMKDRMHESKGMEGHYDGMSSRRKQEMEDGGMIREDKSAIANLPQEVMMKRYPDTGPYMPEDIDDTIRGIDRQMDGDDSKRREHYRPHKY